MYCTYNDPRPWCHLLQVSYENQAPTLHPIKERIFLFQFQCFLYHSLLQYNNCEYMIFPFFCSLFFVQWHFLFYIIFIYENEKIFDDKCKLTSTYFFATSWKKWNSLWSSRNLSCQNKKNYYNGCCHVSQSFSIVKGQSDNMASMQWAGTIVSGWSMID